MIFFAQNVLVNVILYFYNKTKTVRIIWLSSRVRVWVTGQHIKLTTEVFDCSSYHSGWHLIVTLSNYHADGRAKKIDGKPCVRSMTIINSCLKNFRQTSFCKRPKQRNSKWRSPNNMQVIALSRLWHTNVLLILPFCSVCSLITLHWLSYLSPERGF